MAFIDATRKINRRLFSFKGGEIIMALNGEVTTWKMSPEELAAYVKKNPIVPTTVPKDIRFSTDAIDYQKVRDRKKQALKEKGSVFDSINMDKLHKLYMANIRIEEIAEILKVNTNTLNNFVQKIRKEDPEKWPRRKIKRKKPVAPTTSQKTK